MTRGRYRFDKADRVQDRPVREILEAYREWVSVEDFTIIKNTETGEFLPTAVSKLGNVKYAIGKRAQLLPVVDAFNDLILDRPIPGGRDDRHRMGYALLVTLTYNHKLYSAVEAYRRCGEDINRFKARFTKLIDSSYVSMAVKEGTKSGYPAPHLIFIVSRPLPVFLHKGKWRVQDYLLYKAVHEAWFDASGGSYNCDVEAIVGNSVKGIGRSERSAMSYVLKYVMKSSDADSGDSDSQELADLTHAMMKYTGCRDIIGRKFLAFLGLVDDSALPLDLMEKKNELKRLKARRRELKAMEDRYKGAFGWILSPQCDEIHNVDVRIRALSAEIRAMSPPSPWVYFGSRSFGKGQRHHIQTWLDSFNDTNAVIRQGNRHSENLDDPEFIRSMLDIRRG